MASPLHLRRRPALRSVVTALGLLAALLLGGLTLVDLEQERRGASDRGRLLAEAASVRAELEDELIGSIHVARGVRGFVVATPEVADPSHPSAERVQALLAAVYDDGRHLRNIGLAPDNVIRYVHPLEGNEAALGLAYEDVPDQFDAVRRAMELRRSVLVGPVDLVQGGRGLINRTPVFLDDGSYWGVVSLVVDLASMLDAVEQDVAGRDVRWAVQAEDGAQVAGDPSLFEDPAAVVIDVADAGDLAWRLAVAPASALDESAAAIGALRVGVVVLSVVLALLVLLVAEERRLVRELSIRDPLTGLPNRRLLLDRLDQATARADRGDRSLTVLFLDLDQFKPINDEHGHAAGDEVLRTIARRIEQATRASDTAARVGGDEFVVLVEDDPDEDRSPIVVARLREVVAAPIRVGGTEVRVGASVGAARHGPDGRTADELLAAADSSMYDAKRTIRIEEPSSRTDA